MVATLRRRRVRRVLLALLAGISFASGDAADDAGTAPDGNLLRGGGLESDADRWSLSKPEHGASVAIAREGAHTGTCCLALKQDPFALPPDLPPGPDLTKRVKDAHAAGLALASQTVPVEPDHRYDLRFWQRAVGLVRGDGDEPGHGSAVVNVRVLWLDERRRQLADLGCHVWAENLDTDRPTWSEVVDARMAQAGGAAYRAPAAAHFAVVRFELVTTQPGAAPTLWIDDVVFADADRVVAERAERAVELLSPGFEDGAGDAPTGWRPIGNARTAWTSDEHHAGARAVRVADAGQNAFSGWSCEVPVRADATYADRAPRQRRVPGRRAVARSRRRPPDRRPRDRLRAGGRRCRRRRPAGPDAQPHPLVRRRRHRENPQLYGDVVLVTR